MAGHVLEQMPENPAQQMRIEPCRLVAIALPLCRIEQDRDFMAREKLARLLNGLIEQRLPRCLKAKGSTKQGASKWCA